MNDDVMRLMTWLDSQLVYRRQLIYLLININLIKKKKENLYSFADLTVTTDKLLITVMINNLN